VGDKFAIIAVIGLTGFAACMGAAAGFADVSLFDGKTRCATIAAAAGRALDWYDGDQAGLAALHIAR
jgi:hypothetical protein